MRKQNIIFLYSIKLSKKDITFDNVEVNKKEFHVSKQTCFKFSRCRSNINIWLI